MQSKVFLMVRFKNTNVDELSFEFFLKIAVTFFALKSVFLFHFLYFVRRCVTENYPQFFKKSWVYNFFIVAVAMM